MDCKLCIRLKCCPDKDNHPKNCVRFIEFTDGKRFEMVDKVMRHNKGVYIAPG